MLNPLPTIDNTKNFTSIRTIITQIIELKNNIQHQPIIEEVIEHLPLSTIHIQLGINDPVCNQVIYLGVLRCYVTKDWLVMDYIKNTDSKHYKHVGAALFEYAFKLSIRLNLGGRLRLNALAGSFAYHYANGFLPDYDRRFIFDDIFENLCQKYLATKELILERQIKSHLGYGHAKNYAEEVLGRTPTTDEVIQWGMYYSYVEKWGRCIKLNKEYGTKLEESEPAFAMFLPLKRIKELKLLWGLKDEKWLKNPSDEGSSELYCTNIIPEQAELDKYHPVPQLVSVQKQTSNNLCSFFYSNKDKTGLTKSSLEEISLSNTPCYTSKAQQLWCSIL